MIEEEEEEVEDITARMAALPTPGSAAAQMSTPRGAPTSVHSRTISTRINLIATNIAKFHPSASDALKIYPTTTPVPDNPVPNIWSPSRGLPTTRQQARIAQQYMAAMSSSPVWLQGAVEHNRHMPLVPHK